ncbi:MAG: MFS transporter [Dehalococcoidia bacterium]|nr:MFS transporter [Dehalococcoidia bacterium]
MAKGAEATEQRARVAGIALPRMFASLRHRDYRFLWTTSFLSASARNLQQVSLGWIAFDLTGSSVLLGTVLFIYQLPFLVFALPLGALVDRANRKVLLASSQFVMAALAAALAADIALGWVEPWHLMAFAFVSGVENTLIHIIRQSLVPSVVPKEGLLNAVALNSAGFDVSRIAAPAVGGFLIAAIGVDGNFGVQAALLLGVAFASLPMRVGFAPDQVERGTSGLRGLAADLQEAAAYIWNDRLLRQLFAIEYAALLFTVPYLAFMPVWVEEVLGREADALGMLYAAGGVGAVASTLFIAHRGNVRRRGWWIWGALTLQALGLTALSQADGYLATLGVLAFVGALNMASFSLLVSAAQARLPERLQGRGMAIWNLGNASIGIGTLALGFVVARAGVADAMWMTGAAMLAFVVVGFAALGRTRGAF